MICREEAWAFNRFGCLRCMSLSTQGGMTTARREWRIIFILFGLVQWHIQRRGARGHASLLGHRSGHVPWGTNRGPFLVSKGPSNRGPFWLQRGLVPRDFLEPGQRHSKKAVVYQTAINFHLFSVVRFQFQQALLSFRGPRSL